MRAVRWVNELLRVWWPVFVSAAAVTLVATLGAIMCFTLEERDEFKAQAEEFASAAAAQEQLIDRQRAAEAGRDARLASAIAEVEQLLAAQFAEHDLNSATGHNDLLAQITALLGRPAGVVTDPVSARDVDGWQTPPRSPDDQRQPPPQPPADDDPPTPTTTTTTQPGRSDLCDRVPTAFPCRSPR